MSSAMRIGIGTPCHLDDVNHLRECRSSILHLDPKPYAHAVDLNQGDRSLREIREDLFDTLIAKGCNVLLQCSSDFYLFPSILKHVRRDVVTDFGMLQVHTSKARFLENFIVTAQHLFYPHCWTGCYSLPKEVWLNQVKDSWDGSDGSVREIIGHNYKFVKKPLYYAMRPWRKGSTEQFIASMPLKKRLRWRLLKVR